MAVLVKKAPDNLNKNSLKAQKIIKNTKNLKKLKKA